MIKNRNIFKLFLSLTACLCLIKLGYSQPDFKKSYEFSLSNLALADLTFIYTHKLNNFGYLEVSNSFVIHKRKTHDNANILLLTIQDPFLLYDLYRLRAGIRSFYNNDSYICPMLIFNVGQFRNVRIWHYIDRTGDAKDIDYLLTRTKFELGALIKFGNITLSKDDSSLITSIYAGFGFKIKFMYDSIFQKWEWHQPIYDNYPIYEKNMKVTPTIHFGFTLGGTK